jgi:predicted NBD/HSP70 family sugar kinase
VVKSSFIIGLDIGGTTLKAVKIQDMKRIVEQRILPAGGRISRGELAKLVLSCVAEFSRDGRAEAVGLCFGGLLQNDGTMRQGSTNLDNLDGCRSGISLAACSNCPAAWKMTRSLP